MNSLGEEVFALLERQRAVCSRCGKRFRRRSLAEWNLEARNGAIVALVCGACQTPEENAEADIRDATEDYSKVNTVGVDLSRIRREP